MRFSPNGTDWPFDQQAHENDWDQHLDAELVRGIRGWNQFFLDHYDRETGEFPTQEDRSQFFQGYIRLFRMMQERSLDPTLDCWW